MTCSKCYANKPITEFYMSKRLDPVCKECRRKQANERSAKKKQVEMEVNRQLNMVFKQVKDV